MREVAKEEMTHLTLSHQRLQHSFMAPANLQAGPIFVEADQYQQHALSDPYSEGQGW